jgi:hypothetical protein
MASPVKYLEAPLMPMTLCLALCVSEEQYLRELRRLDVKAYGEYMPGIGTNACVHYFVNDKTGITRAFVCVNRERLSEKDPIAVAGVIVHEAVHVWQEICSDIGEKNPGAEFEAYSIQRIAEQLMRSYVEQTS